MQCLHLLSPLAFARDPAAPAGDAPTPPPEAAVSPRVRAPDLPLAAAPAAPAAKALPAPVAPALELAKLVQNDPANADAALAGGGCSRDELEKLLFEIAVDQEMSDLYAEEMGR